MDQGLIVNRQVHVLGGVSVVHTILASGDAENPHFGNDEISVYL